MNIKRKMNDKYNFKDFFTKKSPPNFELGSDGSKIQLIFNPNC